MPIETRSIATNGYGTICLPYDATATGATVMTFKGRSEQGLVFEPVADEVTLTAGVPYLYRATADAQTFTYTGTTYAAATAVNNFTGVYTKTELTAGQYFLYTEDNMFHPAAKAKDASETYVNVGAFKCYFPTLPEVTVQARANSVVFGIYGEATGISEVLNGSNSSNGVNGKLIQNGRVVIVKDGKKYNLAGQIVK